MQNKNSVKTTKETDFQNFEFRVTVNNETEKAEETASSACANADPDDGVPHDRGWAWVVVVGNFINYTLVVGNARAGGVYFVEILDYFQSNNVHTALLFAVKGISLAIGGLFVMNVVVGRLGCRGTILIGGLFLSLSAIFASVANELTFLIIMQAVFSGVAETMILSPAEVVIATYFRRRRTLALALIKSGASLGIVVIPALVTFLLATYGLKGALLLAGAVSLHALPASLLSRPVSYFKRDRKPTEIVKFSNLEEMYKKSAEPAETTFESNKNEKKLTAIENKEPSVSSNWNHGFDSESERTCDPSTRQSDDIEIEEGMGNNKQVDVAKDENYEKSINNDQKPTTKRTAGRKSCLISLSSLFDFSLFRRPTFRLLFIAFFSYPTVNIALDYLPAFAKERGISEDQTADLLSIIGSIDLVGRLGSGLIVDRGLVGVFPLVTFCFLVLGVAYQCARLVTSFGGLVVLAVTQGLLGSVANCMVPVLVLDVVGVDHMAKGLSFYSLAVGSFTAAIHPVLGYIGDRTGSYVAVYHTIGGCNILTAVLLGLQGPVRRLEQTTAK